MLKIVVAAIVAYITFVFESNIMDTPAIIIKNKLNIRCSVHPSFSSIPPHEQGM